MFHWRGYSRVLTQYEEFMILKQLLGILLALALGVGGAWSATRWFGDDAHSLLSSNPNLASGGDFALQSANGPVSLGDFRNKVVIVYFGYTACPDICPTSMATLKQGLKRLTDAELAQVQGIFISVDPERDTPEHVQKYAQYFHPNIMGVTDKPEVLAEIAKRYNVTYRKVGMEGSSMGYTIDHSALLYLIGKDGRVKKQVQHVVPADELAGDIRQLL